MFSHSNRSLFTPFDNGSPRNDLMTHISGLGLHRLDFEVLSLNGETISRVESDAAPTSQADEEARIATLAYAIKKLGNAEDAAEFMRCLNSLCEETDARYRQSLASYYYKEIAARGTSQVLKEMALLEMALTPSEIIEVSAAEEVDYVHGPDDRPAPNCFDLELMSVIRMTRGKRRASKLQHDDYEGYLDVLEGEGLEGDDLQAHLESYENLDQYDEGGAILILSSSERTIACGTIDEPMMADEAPELARQMVIRMRRAYAEGESLCEFFAAQEGESLEDALAEHVRLMFPDRFEREERALANRYINEQILEMQADFHLRSCHTSAVYRQFHKAIRSAKDSAAVSEIMKRAFAARQDGSLSLPMFTALTTASKLQRMRVTKPLSQAAHHLIDEVSKASAQKIKFLSFACYKNNAPNHPYHKLTGDEQTAVWTALRSRKEALAQQAA